MFIESVHRLNDVGTVVTHASRGTSQDDFEAEWRQITLFTLDGDLCNRCEIFDEANLDAALARFDELQTQARRLENAASRSERALSGVLRGPRLGTLWPRFWPTTFSPTIVVAVVNAGTSDEAAMP